jgi:hypothetical protein
VVPVLFLLGGKWLLNWPIIWDGADYFWTTAGFFRKASGASGKQKNPPLVGASGLQVLCQTTLQKIQKDFVIFFSCVADNILYNREKERENENGKGY